MQIEDRVKLKAHGIEGVLTLIGADRVGWIAMFEYVAHSTGVVETMWVRESEVVPVEQL